MKKKTITVFRPMNRWSQVWTPHVTPMYTALKLKLNKSFVFSCSRETCRGLDIGSRNIDMLRCRRRVFAAVHTIAHINLTLTWPLHGLDNWPNVLVSGHLVSLLRGRRMTADVRCLLRPSQRGRRALQLRDVAVWRDVIDDWQLMMRQRAASAPDQWRCYKT